MKFYKVSLTREQLHQVAEGLGMRIDQMCENATFYDPDEIDAAKAALDHVTAVAAEAD